jgi:hypothetical protein
MCFVIVHLSFDVFHRSYRSRCDLLVDRREIDLGTGYRTVGVTSVARFRWTR